MFGWNHRELFVHQVFHALDRVAHPKKIRRTPSQQSPVTCFENSQQMHEIHLDGFDVGIAAIIENLDLAIRPIEFQFQPFFRNLLIKAGRLFQ